MPTLAQKENASHVRAERRAPARGRAVKAVRKPLRMKTWKEAREYLDKHLTPAGHTPSGRPVYRDADIASLNILLPDEV